MKKVTEFITIRYLILLTISIQLVLGYNERNLASIIFICFFVINNQLRLFYFKGKFNYVSIIIEVILSFAVYVLYGGNLILYIVPSIIDSYILLEEKYSKYIIGFIIIGVLVMSLRDGFDRGLMNTAYLTTMILIMGYLRRENKEKINAQELYDELRITEEELKEANDNLENYAASIEELTLLKERNRISREIHDSVGHALSTAMIQLNAMERIGEMEKSKIQTMAHELREFINESLKDVRRAVNELRPTEYEPFEGIFRIDELCKNFSKLTGVEVKLRVTKNKWSLNSKQGSNIYRIIQEALSNALRHGKATKVKINMNFTEEGLVIIIEDNGMGVECIEEKGMGLKNIKERAKELNGEVRYSSEKNKGFKIWIMVSRGTGGVFDEGFNSR